MGSEQAANTKVAPDGDDLAEIASAHDKKPGILDKIHYFIDRFFRFSIMDIIEDDCRVRMLNVWAFLLVYVFFVLGVLRSAAPSADITLGVKISTAAPRSLVAGQSNHHRRMMANVMQVNGAPRQNVSVQPYIVSFYPSGPLPCAHPLDTMRFANTLEGERLQDVCALQIAGTGSTDSMGITYIDGYQISGPTGTYDIGAHIPGEGFQSEEQTSTITRTSVYSLNIIDPATGNDLPAPVYAYPGQPFATQPAIQILDVYGNPVVGAVVTAFTNPDPTWPPFGLRAVSVMPQINRQGQRSGSLNCPKSEPSDANGIARFTCLGMESSTSDLLNIVFSVDNFVFIPWCDPTYDFNSLTAFRPSTYSASMIVKSTIRDIAIDLAPPATVVEGSPFEVRLRLTDSNAAPVAGRICNALITSEYGQRLVARFRRKLVGWKNKDLLFAKSQPSDANGVAVFTQLRVSPYGNSQFRTIMSTVIDSSMGITFVCDGVNSAEAVTTVESRVADVRIKRFITKSAYLSRYYHPPSPDSSDVIIAVVRVVDANGRGVGGKSIYVNAMAMHGQYILAAPIEKSSEPTSAAGFAVVPFRVVASSNASVIGAGSEQFKVKFEVDGVSSPESEVLTALLPRPLSQRDCSLVLPTSVVTLKPGHTDWNNPAHRQVFDVFSDHIRVNSGDDILFEVIAIGGSTQTGITFADHAYNESLASVNVSIRPAYSTEGEEICNGNDCAVLTPYEPQLFQSAEMPDASILEPLTSLNQAPGFIRKLYKLMAPIGTTAVRMKMDINVPPYVQSCYSPPIQIEIMNPLDLFTTYDQQGYSEGQVFSVSDQLELDLTFYKSAGAVASALNGTHLNMDPWYDNAVSLTWLEVPMPWQGAFLSTGNWPKLYNLVETQGYSEDQNGVGRMKVRFTWLMPGMFGNFAFVLASRGVNSNVYRFEISPPPALTLEVIQEPSFQNAWPNSLKPCNHDPQEQCLLTAQPVPTQPQVLVKSNGNPLNGAIVFAELVPVGNSRFEKLTAIQYFDLTGIRNSNPSGYDMNLDSQASLNGIAAFTILGAFDGDGCAQFRFTTGHYGVELSTLYPATPLCFNSAAEFTVVKNPPPSWPIGMQLNELFDSSGRAQIIKVRATFTYGMPLPALVAYSGMIAVRFAVSEFSDGASSTELDLPSAEAYTKDMLHNTVCLFINNVEIFDRCSPIVRVPGTDNQFESEVRTLEWARVTQMPAAIKIMASDLSLTPIKRKQNQTLIPMPPGLPSMNTANKTASCLAAFMQSTMGGNTDGGSPTTISITPEVAATSAMILLPPPSLVEVGETFLVRLQILTKSGAPAKNGRIKVGIAGTKRMVPGAVSSNVLQEMASMGNTLASFKKPGQADLDSATTEQEIRAGGVVSFPLTVTTAKSGNYVLKFQTSEPGASVLLTTPEFIIVNPIGSISQPGAGWTQLEVSQFKRPERIAWQPQFEVRISDGRSLHDLSAHGFPITVQATLKGANKYLIKAKAKMAEIQAQASQRAAQMATEATNTAINAAARQAQNTVQQAIGRLAPDFQAECLTSGMSALQAEATSAAGEVRPASTAEAAAFDPSVLDPALMMGQFVRSATGGGSSMTTASEMTAKLTVTVPIEELALVSQVNENGTFRGVYNITRPLDFHFQEGGQYAWAFSMIGVESASDAFNTFTVIEVQPPFIQRVFDWIITALAGILCVVVLTTNTRKHHKAWYVVGLLATIACLVATPFLKVQAQALSGHWAILAIINISLILLCLIWGLLSELNMFGIITFTEKKVNFQKQYVRTQFCQALSDVMEVVHPEQITPVQQMKQMLKPFNPQTCFYFPTQLLVGLCLALFSFGFLIIKTVELALNIRQTIQALLNKVTDQGLNLMNAVDRIYFTSTGGMELPDEAMQFVLTQLRMVTDWFKSLILGFEIGIWLGCALAIILTLMVLLLTFWDFRRRVLNLRRGKYTFRMKDALIYMDSNFMGAFIATTIVGYLTVVLAITLVTIPLVWDVSRNLLWSMRGVIWWTLLFPLIINQLIAQVMRRCLFGKTFIMHRALCSIYMFWQTWLSFLGGIMTSIIRLGMALAGVIVSLPQMMAACTPAFMNEVACLDSTYKQYIAAVVVYHIHNNPVVNVAADTLLKLMRERKRRMKEDGVSAEQLTKEAQRKTKRILLLLLMKRPSLAKYRKTAIFEREAKAKAEKAAKKQQKVVVEESRKPSPDEMRLISAIHDTEVELAAHQKATQLEVASMRDTLSRMRQLPTGGAEAKRLADAALASRAMVRS